MNTELFIARQLLPRKSKKNISKPIVNIAIIAISLGLTVMILATSIILGFKYTISDKIFGFSSHIQIVNYDSNTSFESIPIKQNKSLYKSISELREVAHIQDFAIKPGIVRVNQSVKGVVIKGISQNFNWNFFQNQMVEGDIFAISDSVSNQVLISKTLADLLQLKLHDSFTTTFISNVQGKMPRKRRFTISGIFETHMQEIDSRFIIADIRHIQALNMWEKNDISGYEIFLEPQADILASKNSISDEVGYDIRPDAQRLKVQTIQETSPHIFDWLAVLDMNAWVIIILMLLVAGMNMITGLLVIILEKTETIGIIKTLGAQNVSVQKVFLYIGTLIIGKGILWGNIVGIGLCALQYYFHIIPLDPETYFMSYVPISFSIGGLLALNIGTLIVTILMLLLPALIITKISPSEAIRFK